MNGNRWTLQLACIAILGATTIAIAEDEPVEFKGYSNTAEVTVGKFLRAIDKVKTYSDEGVIRMKAGVMMQNDFDTSFAFARPNRFRIDTAQHEIISDGKEITVFMKNMRRYTVKPLEKNIHRQVKGYFGGMGMTFGIGELVLHENVRKRFAEQFVDLDLTGREDIEGDRCIILEGKMTGDAVPMLQGDAPVSLYIRESDMMIRRIEIDLLEAMKKQFEGEENMPFTEYLVVYDVRELKVNEKPDEKTFTFEPSAGTKKVDKFYSMWTQTGDTAAQFELSGKPAPEFELELAEGGWASLDDYRGKILVINFLPNMRFAPQMGLNLLDEIRRDYADRKVAIVCVLPGSNADKLTDKFEKEDVWFPVLLDADSTLQRDFNIDRFGFGVVIVGLDGVVQGRYNAVYDKNVADSLRADIDKLLSGEKLEAAKVMTEEQIDEAMERRGARFSFGETAEPLNEERLRETWSVRAADQQSFGFPFGGGGRSRELWVRDKDVAKQVTPGGEIVAEIPLPQASQSQFAQDQFVAGRLGSRAGVVYMKTIPGDEEQMGYRPPKEVELIAVDASGDELWKLSFDVKQYQLPQHLTLANIDGRGGDETLFVHQAALWVVDERGEVVIRKAILGGAKWMTVDDKDRDRRAEIYLRTPSKLLRFDFQP